MMGYGECKFYNRCKYGHYLYSGEEYEYPNHAELIDAILQFPHFFEQLSYNIGERVEWEEEEHSYDNGHLSDYYYLSD